MATVPQARAREHVRSGPCPPPAALGQAPEVVPEAGRLLLPSMGDLGAGQWSSRTRLCSVSTAGAGSSGRRVSRLFSPTRVFATNQNDAAPARPSARLRGRHRERRASGSRPPRPAHRADARRRCRSSPRKGGRFSAARASSKGRRQGRPACKVIVACRRGGHGARFASGDAGHRRRQAGASTFGSARGSLTRVGTRVSVRCV